MIETKICYIGGGSADWAPKLMRDLALQDELTGELRLYDIDQAATEINGNLGERLFSHEQSRSRFAVTTPRELEKALDGAAIVILSIEPGPTELRQGDLEIPARHGIVQTVGDTTGPGGIMRGWRAIPTFREYAEKIARYAPEAWVINYTNPMTLCTAALYEGFSEIKAVGCCHEVPVMREELTAFFEDRGAGISAGGTQLELEIAGINHFTFCPRMEWNGQDMLVELRKYAESEEARRDRSAIAASRRRHNKWFESDHLIALEFLRRFGSYGCAGDRHLAEFVPWFLSSEKELERYGVVRTPYWWRAEKAAARAKRSPEKEAEVLEPSGEEGVEMIQALMGGTETRTNVNFPNRGQISWLPLDHPVETYARVTRDAIIPETPPRLSAAVEELVRRVVAVQDETLRAAANRDRGALLEAVLSDPLVHLPVAETEAMINEMLQHTEEAL